MKKNLLFVLSAFMCAPLWSSDFSDDGLMVSVYSSLLFGQEDFEGDRGGVIHHDTPSFEGFLRRSREQGVWRNSPENLKDFLVKEKAFLGKSNFYSFFKLATLDEINFFIENVHFLKGVLKTIPTLCLEENNDLSVFLSKHFSSHSNIKIQGNIGYMLHRGIVFSQNYSKAIDWYALSSDSCPSSQYHLAKIYENGEHQIEHCPSVSHILDVYNKGLKQSFFTQKNLFLICTLEEYFPDQRFCGDFDRAKSLYEKAASLGDHRAQRRLGIINVYGEYDLQDGQASSVWKENHEEGLRWLEMSANHGSSKSQYFLAKAHEDLRVQGYHEKAFKLYTQSANLGFPLSFFALSRMTSHKEEEFLSKASEHGLLLAKSGLADILRKRSDYLGALKLLLDVNDSLSSVRYWQNFSGLIFAFIPGYCSECYKSWSDPYRRQSYENFLKENASLIERCAEKIGDHLALFDLGRIYEMYAKNYLAHVHEKDTFYKKKIHDAVKIYESLIKRNSNNKEALYRYGRCIEESLSPKEALPFYKKSASLGYGKAHLKLGNLYGEGKGVEKDVEKSSEFLMIGRLSSKENMEYEIAQAYEKGEEVLQSHEKALDWYKKSSDKGNADAAFRVAQMYRHGSGISQDLIKAEKFLRQATSSKSPLILREMGNFLRDQGKVDESTLWFQRAAEAGDVKEQLELGISFQEGKNGPVNYQEAIKWLSLAEKNGSVEAQYRLGLIYENGSEEVPKNISEAIRFYRKASESGHRRAQVRLEKF